MATGMQRTLSPTFAARSGPSSRTPSRPRNSRNSSRASLAYLPQDAASLALPEGAIGAEVTELLNDFVHPHNTLDNRLFGDEPPTPEIDEDDEDTVSLEIRKKLPWHKRPSAVWFLIIAPFAAGATAAAAAPRVELFTELACIAYKDKYQIGEGNNTVNALMQTATMLLAGGLSDSMSHASDKKFCAKEPIVQAAVARLSMMLALSLGILSCMTAGWWGSISDRYGRVTVLRFAVFGLLVNDVIFLSTVHFHRYLPGGYLFLLLGPLLDGLCGGMTALSATIHAYLADCTEQEDRSRVFSLFLGLTFAGFGLGPTLGSILVRTTNSVLSVFYVAAAAHCFHASLVWFVVPESLSLRRQLEARKTKKESDEAALADKRSGPVYWLSRAFGFLAPLALFYPVVVEGPGTNPLKRKKRDWNLLCIAMSYGSLILLMGSYAYKFQYTSFAFGWGSEQIGYWMSAVGATRAVHLTIILPLAIRLFKPKPKTGPIHLPNVSTDNLSHLDADLEERTAPSTSSAAKHRSVPFDLAVSKVSLLVEAISYIAVCFTSTAPLYTIFTMSSAFGAGFAPAIQSVALALYTERGGTESGKLFGAMSVVQSLCSQIIGPTVFGTIYMKTAGTFPKTIFYVAAGAVTFSFIVVMFVRSPHTTVGMHITGETAVEVSEQDETLFDPEVPLIVVDDVGGKSSSTSRQASPAL
ncbi:major facilitator superfamily domain-containing protein [Cytidiella melzeri]|nr:major facilitator superfamily domain-containing protein [Cytidiella melzeri]